MYLYTRTARRTSSASAAALAFAVEAGGYVQTAAGRAVATWTTVFGAPLGGVAWSMRTDSMGEIGELQDTLATDTGYADLMARGDGLLGEDIEDNVEQVLAATCDEEPREFAAIVSAQCAPGRISDAMSWGADMTEAVGALTGLPVVMVRPMFGSWAGLGWIMSASSLAELERANDALSNDPTHLEKIDVAGDLFVATVTEQRLIRQLV